MAWVKLDDGFPDHPKIDHLSDGAFRLHVSALCHSGRYLTDGFIPFERPSRLMTRYRDKYVQELLRAGVWDPTTGGYQIHQFTDYQKSRDWWVQKRATDAKRMEKWRSERAASNGHGGTDD